MKSFDTIIIGIGPSGIQASIYLKRFGFNVLAIGKDFGALEKADKIDNYYAFGTTSGKEIVMNGIKQATELGVFVNHDEVLSIDYAVEGFDVKTKKGMYNAKTIYLATGTSRNTFKQAEKFEGKGVSYCATCDGFFYKGKNVALVGYNEYMLNEFEHLYPLVNNITVFTNGNKLEVELPKDVKVISEKISTLIGDERFTGVQTETEIYEFAGLFVALGSANAFTLAKHLGLDIDDNKLIVDENMMTNIPGIFAGGDVIGGIYQIVKAASDGAKAGYSINKYLRNLNK